MIIRRLILWVKYHNRVRIRPAYEGTEYRFTIDGVVEYQGSAEDCVRVAKSIFGFAPKVEHTR